MAAQLGRPEGDIGIAVGDYMSAINAQLIKAAYSYLAPPPQGRVLEIGVGNGKLIGDLLEIAPGVSYVGVDVSETMVYEARKNNQALRKESRLMLHVASVEALPFPDADFDAVVCQFGVMFFPDKARAFAEARGMSGRGFFKS